MMLAADHTPQPREVAFCKIGVSAVEAVSLGMIDPFHFEGGGEHVPVPKIVGGDYAALDDAFSCEGDAIGFPSKRPSQSSAGTLPQRHDHTPLVRPVLEKTPIDAVGFEVDLADMATEIGTIHLNRVAQPQLGRLGRQRFAQLVGPARRPSRRDRGRAARRMPPWPRSRTDRWQPADRRRRASGKRRSCPSYAELMMTGDALELAARR